jgi:transposase InsO family protein
MPLPIVTVHRGTWSTIAVTSDAIADYIERFYNVRRRHSTLDYISPLEYELSAARVRRAA